MGSNSGQLRHPPIWELPPPPPPSIPSRHSAAALTAHPAHLCGCDGAQHPVLASSWRGAGVAAVRGGRGEGTRSVPLQTFVWHVSGRLRHGHGRPTRHARQLADQSRLPSPPAASGSCRRGACCGGGGCASRWRCTAIRVAAQAAGCSCACYRGLQRLCKAVHVNEVIQLPFSHASPTKALELGVSQPLPLAPAHDVEGEQRAHCARCGRVAGGGAGRAAGGTCSTCSKHHGWDTGNTWPDPPCGRQQIKRHSVQSSVLLPAASRRLRPSARTAPRTHPGTPPRLPPPLLQ